MAINELDAVADDPVGDRNRLLGIALVIFDIQLDLPPPDTASSIDRLGGGLRPLLELIADRGELPRHRPHNRDGNVFGVSR